MKGLSPAGGPGQARTERPETHLVVIGKRKAGGRPTRPSANWAWRTRSSSSPASPSDQIIELYSEAELAVVPSLYEGFSLPAIEAMSCGTPLIATSGGALPEVVGADGETALVVPPGDSEALAAKLRWALGRDDLRDRGRPGRQRVVDQWSWQHTAKTVEQYRILLDQVGAG